MRSAWWWAALGILTIGPVHGAAQEKPPAHLLEWVSAKDDASYLGMLRKKLDRLTDFFVRVTSPDISRDAKHLWIISTDGKSRCVVSDEAGVAEPRWGAAGSILYLVEADTNGDGGIDFADDYVVRVVQPSGAGARTLTQGASAVWAPDGRHAAVLQKGSIVVVSGDGKVSPLGTDAPAGKLVATNSRALSGGSQFWTVDARTRATQSLPQDLRAKYLWLGAVSPSATKLAYATVQKTDIFVRPIPAGDPDHNLTNDRHLDLAPSWSPDERHVVYVSDNPEREPRCSSQQW